MNDQSSDTPPHDFMEDEVQGLPKRLVEEILDTLARRDRERLAELVQPLHPADVADVLENLKSEEREAFIEDVGPILDAEVITYIDENLRNEVTLSLGFDRVASFLKQLDSDDALQFFEDLDDDLKAQILARVPATIQRILQEGLKYPEDSAARLMQREIVVVPMIWTVGDLIDYLRANSEALTTDFYDLYVVDPRYKPIGKLPLSRVLRTGRNTSVTDVMDESLHPVSLDMDQEEVAYLFRKYSLISSPVVDSSGRLVGVITVDDIVLVIDEEAEEDLMKLSGVGASELYGDIRRTARTRLPWLGVNLINALIASYVISFFDATIEQIVALAILMPIVASMGGNTGTQSMTVTVRAMALKELVGPAARRYVIKEILVGHINGYVIAIATGFVSWLWFDTFWVGVIIAVSISVNMTLAGLFGTLIPMALEKFKIDPAVASPVFLTTITDAVGFFAFLGLATLFLL